MEERSAVGKFLVPEDEISLKVVFDNQKNYAIVGGIAYLAHKLWQSGSREPAIPYRYDETAHVFFDIEILLGCVLLAALAVAVFYQSFIMVDRLSSQIRSGIDRRVENSNWFVRALGWLASETVRFVLFLTSFFLPGLGLLQVFGIFA